MGKLQGFLGGLGIPLATIFAYIMSPIYSLEKWMGPMGKEAFPSCCWPDALPSGAEVVVDCAWCS